MKVWSSNTVCITKDSSDIFKTILSAFCIWKHPIKASPWQMLHWEHSIFLLTQKCYLNYFWLCLLKAPPPFHGSVDSHIFTRLWLTQSPVLGKILNTDTEEPMTSWSHKYYVLCFPHCCLMFHIEVGTIKQTTAHKEWAHWFPVE